MNEYSIQCKEGDILLDCINEIGIPDISVFGVCNKQLACHSCAIHILQGYDKIKPPTEEELDVHSELGDVYREKATRMSCQIVVDKQMEGIAIEIPRSAFFLLSDEDQNKSLNKPNVKKLN